MGGAPEGASKILTLKHIHLRVGRAQSREATARPTYPPYSIGEVR